MISWVFASCDAVWSRVLAVSCWDDTVRQTGSMPETNTLSSFSSQPNNLRRSAALIKYLDIQNTSHIYHPPLPTSQPNSARYDAGCWHIILL